MNEHKELVTNEQLEGVCEGFVTDFMKAHYGHDVQQVDVNLFATEYLGLDVQFAHFAENQNGQICRVGYLSDGEIPVPVEVNGKKGFKVYPVKTVVLESRLRQTGKEEDLRKLRFTMAHECGHWIMIHYNTKDADEPRPTKLSVEEQLDRQQIREDQANRCAAIILMPRFLMMEALQKLNEGQKIPLYGEVALTRKHDRIVQKMADSMGVNYMPMRYRLGELELYEPHPMQELVHDILGHMHGRFDFV